MNQYRANVAVVGAGVIGVTVAAHLLRGGYRVTLLDHQGIAGSTSSGNAGAFAWADMAPLNRPAILLKAPGWFFDPLGPLAIPPGYSLKILPWLARFAWACRPSQVRRSTRTMRELMLLSRMQAEQFWPEWGLEKFIVRRGCLNLFEHRKHFQSARAQWNSSAEQGFEVQFLDAEEIHELEPALCAGRARHAVRVLDWPTVTDPEDYTRAIGEKALAEGANLVEQRVNKIILDPDGRVRVESDSGHTRTYDKLVLCAGAWSGRLAALLGDRIPLDTERGYNTTLPEPGIDLHHMLVFAEHAFVATPMTCGLRIGGANELAGTEHPPNYQRADHLLEKARQFLPGLKNVEGARWMGCRPSLPDAQPVIDIARASRNVVYAFGHGHYGLTQSAGTARLVLELLEGSPPSMDMNGLKADRF